MAAQQHLDLLKQGKVVWNEWRKQNPNIHPDLSKADLSNLSLEEANLSSSNLEEANFFKAQLTGAILFKANLNKAQFSEANLEGANLNDIQSEQTNFNMAQLKKAQFIGSQLKGAYFIEAQLEDSDFSRAYMRGVRLIKANLKGAKFIGTHLEKANLFEAHLEGAKLIDIHLEGVILKGAYLDGAEIKNATVGDGNKIGPYLVDVHWGNTNLASIKWSEVEMLGEENEASRKKRSSHVKDEYEIALRANRQLATILEAQGLNEMAAHFAYHAQKLQRVLLWQRKQFGLYLFSCFLDLLAGYGYKPSRSFIWYLVTIFGFTSVYFIFGHLPFFPDALVFSFMAFHGRGFLPSLNNVVNLHAPLVVLAACEAVIGVFVEISFIATFTQKYFGK